MPPNPPPLSDAEAHVIVAKRYKQLIELAQVGWVDALHASPATPLPFTVTLHPSHRTNGIYRTVGQEGAG